MVAEEDGGKSKEVAALGRPATSERAAGAPIGGGTKHVATERRRDTPDAAVAARGVVVRIIPDCFGVTFKT